MQRSESPDVAARAFIFVAASSLLLLCLPAFGQAAVGKPSVNRLQAQTANEPEEDVAILEIGAATSWNIRGGAATFAPNLAAEITPIENWLELEAGVSPFYTRDSSEWDTDFLFKKPWTISRKAEFMLGIGPQWTFFKQNGKTNNSMALEVAGDF